MRVEMNTIYNEDDRQYLLMLQENITRMSGYSANCKTWLVTIVAALLTAGIAVQNLSHWMFMSLFPIIVFWQLDVYYLKMERGLRNRQRLFINLVTAEIIDVDAYKKALFNFKVYECALDDVEKGLKATVKLDFTESESPFYPVIMGIAIVVSVVLLFAN